MFRRPHFTRSGAAASAALLATAACITPIAVSAPAASAAAPIGGTGIGERPNYTLLAAPLADRVAVEVNPGTGNLELRSTDVQIRGTGLNYSLVRYYNSMATGSGAFGQNDTMSNGADVHLTPGANGTVTYTAPSGFAVVYTPSGATSYTSPATYQAADLAKTGSGWTLTFHASGEKLSFDSSGRLTSDADRNGNANTYAYNSDGTLHQVTDTQGRVTSFDYEAGRIHSLTDPAGRHTLYAYDSSGDLTQVTDPTGAVWKFSYWESNSNLDQIVDPRGNSETFTYDSSHRVTKATFAAYTNAAASTTYSYNPGRTVVTDPLGHATTYNYDNNSGVTNVTDPLGNSRSTSYDASGNVTSRTDPSAAVTNYSYLSGARLASVQMPTETIGGGGSTSGATTTIAYGNSSQPYLPSQVTDPQGGQTRYGYDTAGNTTTASTYNADGSTTSTANTTTDRYQGDVNGSTTTTCGAKAGELCTSTTPGGGTTSYGYDSLGNVTSISPPAPLSRQTYAYDSLSRITSSTDGDGNTTTYKYDSDDRLLSTTTAGTTVTYTYDACGNLTSRADATGKTTYSYDAANHLTNKAAPNSWGRTYTHDLGGNLTSASDSGGPAGTTSYAYDAANEPVRVTDPTGAVTTIGWTNARRTSTSYPDGVTQTVSYDNAGRPVHTVAAHGSTTLVDQTGSYQTTAGKDQELLQSVKDKVTGTTTSYSYDGLDRLIDANTTGSTSSDYRYVLDADGNRTQSVINGVYSAIDTFNAADQLVKRGGAGFGGYDADGNATSDGTGQAYGYNATNQTIRITPPNASTISAGYADSDQNERINFGSTTSVVGLLGDDQDTANGSTTYFTRDPAGQLVNERTSNGSYYYLFDLRGSVAGLTDSSGSMVDKYSYDPYGNLTSPANAAPVANPWRYDAAYFDASTGLYHLGARYYDPKLGRFTQVDPSHRESNSYAFVQGDPVDSSDPSGLGRLNDEIANDANYAQVFGVIGGVAGFGFGGPVGAAAGGLIGGAIGVAVGAICYHAHC